MFIGYMILLFAFIVVLMMAHYIYLSFKGSMMVSMMMTMALSMSLGVSMGMFFGLIFHG